MKIAYLISAYKDPIQLSRLIKRLNNEDIYFYIHIDKNVDIKPFLDTLDNMENVSFTNTRFNVSWGGWSQVLYQRELIKSALSNNLGFNRLFLISGQDYPIKSNEYIKKELEKYPHKIYLKAIDYSSSSVSQINKQDYRCYHFFRDVSIKSKSVKRALIYSLRNIMRILPIRKPTLPNIYNNHTHIYKASGYMGLTLDCAKYILHELDNNKKLINFFKHSFVPEELVIPTIIFNSKYKQYAQTIKGNYKGLKLLSGLTYFNYGKEIQVFKDTNLKELRSTELLFARKFETGISDRLMDILDNE